MANMRSLFRLICLAPLLRPAQATDLPCKCKSLSLPEADIFDILSTQGQLVTNYTVDSSIPPVSFCNVSVTLTHSEADDLVNIEVWLPLDQWNGRFLATGGGGYVAGYEPYLMEPILMGYATALTDAGLSVNGTIDPSTAMWALAEPGKTNWPLVTNFAYRSIHDMTVIAKNTIREFYGTHPAYSYYSGCSTGGRMGYSSAEHYPDDFDGILANAPALHSANLSVGMEWPTAVMHDGEAVPQCVLDAYQKAYITACDELDGGPDGIISQPEKCNFDPNTLVGAAIDCSLGTFTITSGHADAVSKITRGPRSEDGKVSWFGITPGTPFANLANTTTVDNVTYVEPAAIGEPWMKYFVAKDPEYSLNHLTVAEFERMYLKSVEDFTSVLGSENPDLTAFQRAGHKLLTWHGLADEAISYEGTTWYFEALERTMGIENWQTDEFYRLFLAPGVNHCKGGYGPIPLDPFDALVQWVEGSNAPSTLFASISDDTNTTVTRNLCRYPQQQIYTGGDVNDANSFICQ